MSPQRSEIFNFSFDFIKLIIVCQVVLMIQWIKYYVSSLCITRSWLIIFTLRLDAQKWFLEMNWVGIPNLEWKGNDLQFKFCYLDGLYCDVGITEWYPFTIPVWMYKPRNWIFFKFEQYTVVAYLISTTILDAASRSNTVDTRYYHHISIAIVSCDLVNLDYFGRHAWSIKYPAGGGLT
jgi:hypothetical protein